MSEPTDLSAEDLARLEALAKAATPGPWRVDDSSGDWHMRDHKGHSLMSDMQYYPWAPEQKDFRYIAAASPDVIQALISMARRATPEAIRAKLSDDAFLDRLCIALECSGTPDPVELIAARLTSED